MPDAAAEAYAAEMEQRLQRPLRVMQITHDLAIGGLQQVVLTLCKTIRRDQFECSVLCLRNLGPFEHELRARGIAVFSLSRKPGNADYFSFLKVAKILRNQRIDVIHTHNTHPLIDGTMGAMLAGVKTIIHTDHARQFPDKRRYMVFENLLSHFVYRMIGVSDDTSNNLRKYERISKERLLTIPNGIDPEPYNLPVDCKEVRRSLGVPPDGSIIGTIARLSTEKALGEALEAFSRVKRQRPQTYFVIVGEGPCEQELRDKAQALGLQDSVIFTGRRVDIPRIVRTIDIFVLSSFREGLPMAVLEAMAGGCPIVAYAVGGVPNAVISGQNGYLVTRGACDEMAARITELLDDSEKRRSFGKRGREIFIEKFSAETMTKAYERLYMRLSAEKTEI